MAREVRDGGHAGWATQQLTEFLALISRFDDEETATDRAVERVAEVLDAEVAVMVDDRTVVTALGFESSAPVPAAVLACVRESTGPTAIELPGIGLAHVLVAVIGEADDSRLLVGRQGEPFSAEEHDLLRGMARVLALGTQMIRLLHAERRVRAESERRVAENWELFGALRERQALLERLSDIQRSIAAGTPVHEVFEDICEGASDLIGDFAGLRLPSAAGALFPTLVASAGLEPELMEIARRAEPSGILARAIEHAELTVADAASANTAADLPAEAAEMGFKAAMFAPVFDQGEAVGCLGVTSRDPGRVFSERDQQMLTAFAEHVSLAINHARALDDATREALRDSLTGLANRSLFLDRTTHAESRARRTDVPIGVLFIDLDDFKTINDSLGHGAGDALLQAVARRLAGCLRPSDTIARLGGDEFAILLEELSESGDAARAATRVIEALRMPFEIGGREIYIGASVGIAAGVDDGESLLRDADLAMYRAKEKGKGRYEAFEPGMHTAVVDRLELEHDLTRAVEQGELELSYQPLFNLRDGRVASFEALVRWNHPTRGLLFPDSFIPLAEASGRIHALGRWVLRRACHQAALWRAKYPAALVRVGVNVSGAQLLEPQFVGEVASAIENAQLEPDGLVLEITETALMADLDGAIARLSKLKEVGVHVAVDDFGTGYSSLRYLQRLPLDILKIAGEFVADSHPNRAAILRAILDLADAFGLHTVAEGIETEEQREMMLGLGARLGQGNFLSEPIPARDADVLLLQSGLLGDAADLSRSESPASPAAES